MVSRMLLLACTSVVAGCAGVKFGDENGDKAKSLIFFDPVPYLFVATTADCVSSASLMALPGEMRTAQIKNGYGSSEASLAFAGGILTTVGQKTDSKVPETLTAVGTAIAAFGGKPAGGDKPPCVATAVLYPVSNGIPDVSKPIAFPIKSN
jgi:hypothetical protein